MKHVYVAVLALALGSQTVLATTWTQKTVVDPISGAECEVSTPMSWGSYVYDWPSRYDGVFWPYTEFAWLWYCPSSGYVSFGGDFDDISDAEKVKISEFLASIRPLLQDEIDLATRLWLADRIYALRDKDDVWRAWYQRVRARLLETIANESRRNSIPLLESSLAEREVDAQVIIERLVLARYRACFDHGGDGRQDLGIARKAIAENATLLGKSAVTYLGTLADDIEKQMNECGGVSQE